MLLESVTLLQQLAGAVTAIDHNAVTVIHHATASTSIADHHHTAGLIVSHPIVPTALDIALANPPDIQLTDAQIKEIFTLVLAGTTASLMSDTIKNTAKSLSSLAKNQLLSSASHKIDKLEHHRDEYWESVNKLRVQKNRQSTKMATQILKRIEKIDTYIEMLRKFKDLLSANSNEPSIGSLALALD